MSTEAMRIDGLVKGFGSHTVLDQLDLALPRGSTTAVVGASGCGKTTLLRLIAGFERPDDGSIAIGGRTVADTTVCIPPHHRDVGYVAQDGALFPHLTVERNIAYGLRGLRSAAVKARVAELLDMVALPRDHGARRPHELSGGQQQRVALARALARQPALMLLDEPFSALDTGLRAATRKSVATTLTQAGVTTLLVTHDQEEALSFADQVAVMRCGRFTQVGTPGEVYLTPRDRYTAAFLGECVFLPATVGSTTADCALGRISVRGSDIHGTATVMLRPEQLSATLVGDCGDAAGAGTVIASEFLGSDVIVTIDLPGDGPPINVRQASIDAPEVNAKVRIEITGAAVVFETQR
jgi:iron(III) transport system ATP-binding protein